MALIHFLGTQSADNKQTRLRVETQEIMQPFQRLLVTPLQVVQHQQKRLAGGQNGVGQGFKETLALPTLAHGFRARQRWALDEKLWPQASHLDQPEVGQSLPDGVEKLR